MKKTGVFFISALSLCVLGGMIYLAIKLCSPKTTLSSGYSCGEESNAGCTVFTISKDEQVFFGGNDDYINPDSYYWVDPGNAEHYGAIWIGKIDNVQQGINERGLAYDANGLPRVDTNPHPEREPVLGGYTFYPIQILHECATVEEVIEWVNTYRWHSYMHDQMQFADASGDAVIISAGADGELVFTRKPAGDGFLVSTNFNVANPNNGYGYPCERYNTATMRLSELLDVKRELTVEDAVTVLQAVSVSGGSSWTLESLVADLPNGLVYLYYFRQFDQPVILNVAEEITNDRPSGPLSELFPDEVRQEATRRYQRALSNQGLCAQIGQAWIGLGLASLILMFTFERQKPRRLSFWLLLSLFLGPLAVLIWLTAGRKQVPRPWQAALVEAAGHLPPIMIAFMVALMAIIVAPQTQSNQLLQIVFVLVLPLLLGVLFYQGPLLALAARRGYLRTLGQRFPVVWVVSNLGLTGINTLAIRLVRWMSATCSMMNPSLWIIIAFWAAVVIGACLGLLLILVYEGWAVRHGFQAWNSLARGDGEVTAPSWRMLWWWILLSYIVVIGGVFLNR